EALTLIADAIRGVFARQRRRSTMVLLEHTAGQGRTVGYRFEHLAAIIDRLDHSPRVGVCLDTCHLIASGYDIVSEAGYRTTFDRFERLVGLKRPEGFQRKELKRALAFRSEPHQHNRQGRLDP